MEFKVVVNLHRLQAIVVGRAHFGAGICKVVRCSDNIPLGWDKGGDSGAVGDGGTVAYPRRNVGGALNVEAKHINFAGGFPLDQDRVFLGGGCEGGQRDGC